VVGGPRGQRKVESWEGAESSVALLFMDQVGDGQELRVERLRYGVQELPVADAPTEQQVSFALAAGAPVVKEEREEVRDVIQMEVGVNHGVKLRRPELEVEQALETSRAAVEKNSLSGGCLKQVA